MSKKIKNRFLIFFKYDKIENRNEKFFKIWNRNVVGYEEGTEEKT